MSSKIGNLYFDDKFGNRKIIAENISEDEVCRRITATVKSIYPEYIIYYFNIWEEEGIMTYDFGSYSEFFRFIKEI